MTTTPAGWYPDPYGSPNLRWWDGTQWTDAVHSPQPGEPTSSTGSAPPGPVTTGPTAAPTQQWQPPTQPLPNDRNQYGPSQWAAPGSYPHAAYPAARLPMPEFGGEPPRKTAMWPWIVGSVAVVVVLVLAIGGAAVYLNDRAESAASRPPGSAPTLDSVVPPPTTAPPMPQLPQPAGGRITDPQTGLSYLYPGREWLVPQATDINDPGDPRRPLWTSACMAPSQENYDGQNHDWYGTIETALLPTIFPYSGTGSLRVVTEALLDTYEQEFYPPAHERKIVRSEAIEVSGRQAWVTEFVMDFSRLSEANGWKWKTERGAFVLVDRGAGQRPAMFYLSIPDNLDESLFTRVLGSLEAR